MDVPPQRGPTANRDPTATSAPPSLRPLGYGGSALRSDKRGGETEKDHPHPFPLPRHRRASIKGEGVASKPFGADGSIAEEKGVVKTFSIADLRFSIEPVFVPAGLRRGKRQKANGWHAFAPRGSNSNMDERKHGTRRTAGQDRPWHTGVRPGFVFRLRPLGYAETSRTTPGQGRRAGGRRLGLSGAGGGDTMKNRV